VVPEGRHPRRAGDQQGGDGRRARRPSPHRHRQRRPHGRAPPRHRGGAGQRRLDRGRAGRADAGGRPHRRPPLHGGVPEARVREPSREVVEIALVIHSDG